MWIQERVEAPTQEELADRFQDPEFKAAMEYVQAYLVSALG